MCILWKGATFYISYLNLDLLWKGTFKQQYTNGHQDSTTVNCDGSMVWNAGTLYKRTLQRVNDDGVPHPDHLYEGWFYRPFNREAAWEFYRFTSNGQLEVHHFFTDSTSTDFTSTSPLGSPNYCCSSLSMVEKGGRACNQGN